MGKKPLTFRLMIVDERVWRRDCDRVPKKQLDRIEEKIRLLERWSTSAEIDVKKLQHYDCADFRLRVGDYRILFTKDDKRRALYLLRVLHRSQLY